jgi:hypothetical protein
MATADTASITNLPPTGLPLREAVEHHCPFWSEHKRREILRIRIAHGLERSPYDPQAARQLLVETKAAWGHVVAWLHDQLNNGWELWATDKLTGELEQVLPDVIERLVFEPDFTARGPHGQVLYALHVYSTCTRAPKPPLLVTMKGEHRNEDAEIVKAADEEFPDGGWRGVRPKTLVVNRVINRMNWDSSKRDRVLRALGWRQG